MHDITAIRQNPDLFDAGLARRGIAGSAQDLVALDAERRAAVTAAQSAQERANALSKGIGSAMQEGAFESAARLKAEAQELRAGIPGLKEKAADLEETLRVRLAGLPNLPLADVPDGQDEDDNVLRHERMEARRAHLASGEPHEVLGHRLGLMDFEAAARMSGARFVVLKGALARMERALGQFMLDLHTGTHGYTEVAPPVLVRDAALYGTAQLPKFADDQFRAGPEHWLIPTAEVPLTNLVREQILPERALPLRYTALTPCFRLEAGSAGRDTRGMLRQHQFHKVELVAVTTPQASSDEHERMLACAETVLKALDLRYRVVTLCAGDMGFAAAKTYDIEVWMPGQGVYREISSVSTCQDFQARRMNARYRTAEGRTEFVHTLNGSGIAVGRALIAVMENYQDGGTAIAVPAALQPYMGGLTAISAVDG